MVIYAGKPCHPKSNRDPKEPFFRKVASDGGRCRREGTMTSDCQDATLRVHKLQKFFLEKQKFQHFGARWHFQPICSGCSRSPVASVWYSCRQIFSITRGDIQERGKLRR